MFPKAQSGGLLIEVLVSLLILSIGMVSAVGMMLAGQKGLSAGQRIGTAASLAQAGMEERLLRRYDELAGGSLLDLERVEEFVRTVSVYPHRPLAHTLTVKVRVEWTDRLGRSHGIGLQSIVPSGVVP